MMLDELTLSKQEIDESTAFSCAFTLLALLIAFQSVGLWLTILYLKNYEVIASKFWPISSVSEINLCQILYDGTS